MSRDFPPEICTVIVKVRDASCDSFHARCNGKSASCTSSRELAAKRCVIKAAQQLHDMGVIPSVPQEDEIELIPVVERQIYHVHLGPVILGQKEAA